MEYGADDTVGSVVQRSGLSLPCVAVLAGRVLDASVRVCELGLSAHSHLVLLSSALPRKEALAAAAAAAAHSRPLFDPAAVSGMLAQLNLQFQPQQQQQVQQQQQQQQQQRPRFSPQHEALLLEWKWDFLATELSTLFWQQAITPLSSAVRNGLWKQLM